MTIQAEKLTRLDGQQAGSITCELQEQPFAKNTLKLETVTATWQNHPEAAGNAPLNIPSSLYHLLQNQSPGQKCMISQAMFLYTGCQTVLGEESSPLRLSLWELCYCNLPIACAMGEFSKNKKGWNVGQMKSKCPSHMLKEFVHLIAVSEEQRKVERSLLVDCRHNLILISPKQQAWILETASS